MKAISLKQPWASFIAIGQKTIETRTWKTNYRGELLIVSSKSKIEKGLPYAGLFNLKLEFGKALAIVNLVDCRPMKKIDEEKAMCDYFPDLYSWILSEVKKIEAFPVRGQLGLYEVNYET